MLGLFLVMTFALPSVFEACCFPDQMSYVSYIPGMKGHYDTLIDYKHGKAITRPVDDDYQAIEFTLFDFNTKKSFTKRTKGKCISSDLSIEGALPRCIPKDAKSVGTHKLGSGLMVETFVEKNDGGTFILTVTQDTCIPVMSTMKYKDTKLTEIFGGDLTSIFANVTTTGLDFTDLHHDVSECKDYTDPDIDNEE